MPLRDRKISILELQPTNMSNLFLLLGVPVRIFFFPAYLGVMVALLPSCVFSSKPQRFCIQQLSGCINSFMLCTHYAMKLMHVSVFPSISIV